MSRNKMRIALFSGNYNYVREGANQALNRLVAYLESEYGHEVRVYSPVSETPAFEPAGTLVPVPSVAVPVRSEFRLALGLPRSIRTDLAIFAPDLIHLSTPDILGIRAQTYAIRHNIPVVASLHTRFETYLEYYRLGFLRPVLKAHLDRFYRRCDHVLAPTPAIVAEIRALRGDDHVSLWSRGVDHTLFDPARRDPAWRAKQVMSDEEVVILFFGRLVLEKGVTSFVEAVSQLQQAGLRVRPLVVGAGPASAAFDRLAGVVRTGHLDGADLARAVASADIMLNPSTSEAFGNVVLEGMAAGLAIVSANAPSAAALIEHGVSGLLVPNQLKTYVAAVEALVADPERRAALGRAARHASAAYSWDAASQSVNDAYRALVGV